MSLLRIQTVPTPETMAIQLNPADNVAIARVAVASGQTVRVAGQEVRASRPIPAGHKIALRQIGAGERVTRYGCGIGRASVTIEPGDHVHTHNLASPAR